LGVWWKEGEIYGGIGKEGDRQRDAVECNAVFMHKPTKGRYVHDRMYVLFTPIFLKIPSKVMLLYDQAFHSSCPSSILVQIP